jgi:hypothetical protein
MDGSKDIKHHDIINAVNKIEQISLMAPRKEGKTHGVGHKNQQHNSALK